MSPDPKKLITVRDLTDDQYEIFNKVIKRLQKIMSSWLPDLDNDTNGLETNKLMQSTNGKRFLIANNIIQVIISAPAFSEAIDSYFDSDEQAIEFIDKYVISYDDETKKIQIIDTNEYE